MLARNRNTGLTGRGIDTAEQLRQLMSGLPVERVKFGFLKDYAIRGM